MDGKTVLVVDGNETSRTFLSETLRKKQIQILEASSGKEASIFAWRDRADLVIFDPLLSDIHVEEFIQKLRHDVRLGWRD